MDLILSQGKDIIDLSITQTLRIKHNPGSICYVVVKDIHKLKVKHPSKNT